jgi:hypothetical protein
MIAGKVKLETAYAGQGALRSTDFSWKIRESGQVDTQHGCVIGKLASRKLHAIAGIAGEFDDDIP